MASYPFPPRTSPKQAPGHNTSNTTTRVVIIHSNRLQADLLRSYCLSQWGLDVVGVANSGSVGINTAKERQPDFILATLQNLDLELEAFTDSLRKTSPAGRLIGLISHCSEFLVHRLSRVRLHGLLYEPEAGLETLGHALEYARQGQRYYSPRIIHYQTELRNSPVAFPKLLSNRELEVLVGIANSLTDDELADRFSITPGTAHSHRKRIMRKLGINRTPKLIRYCMDKGFCS